LTDTLGIAGTLHYIAEALRDLGDFERSAELVPVPSRIGAQTDSAVVAATVHSLGDLYLDTAICHRRALLP